jgi:hypothetical protein
MYTKDQLTNAIARAVQGTLSAIEADPNFRTMHADRLIKLSGLQPPTPSDPITLHQSWSLNLMRLREEWREQILDITGRFPRTDWGTGFEILSPSENLDYASADATRNIVKAIRRSSNILEKTRDSDLDMTERRRKINHQVRLGALEGSARQAVKDAERDKLNLESTPNITLPNQTFSE